MTMTYNLTWLAVIPAGWRPILHDTVKKLHAIDPTIRIVQAKEKFGSLRIYVDRGAAEAYVVIDAATDASRHACEMCSEDARLLRTPDGYYSTRCPRHAAGLGRVEDSPTVTVRIVVDDEENDPRADNGGEHTHDGSAR